MLTLPLLRRRARSASGFDPATLFAASPEGLWYSRGPTYDFTDTGGTTPAAATDAVARFNDRSGNGYHATQSTPANQALLQGSAPYYLDFDGAGDLYFPTGPVDTNTIFGVAAYTIVMGIRHDTASTDTTNGFGNVPVIGEGGGYWSAGFVRSSGKLGAYQWDTGAKTAEVDYTVGETVVFTQKYAGGVLSAQVNNETPAIVSVGALNASAGTLVVGKGLPATTFDGRLFEVIAVNYAMTDEQLAGAKAYVAGLSGVTL